MNDLVLIGCSAKKMDTKTAVPARLLYQGRLFLAQLEYARQVLGVPDNRFFVLSAKYGVVAIEALLKPYDVALRDMNADERKLWGMQVAYSLGWITGNNGRLFKTIYVLAGKQYSTPVHDAVFAFSTRVVVPHPDGAGYAQQVAWYEAELAKEKAVQG